MIIKKDHYVIEVITKNSIKYIKEGDPFLKDEVYYFQDLSKAYLELKEHCELLGIEGDIYNLWVDMSFAREEEDDPFDSSSLLLYTYEVNLMEIKTGKDLKVWQENKNFSARLASEFLGVSQSTYEKWLYEINRVPDWVKIMIKRQS